MLGGDRWSAFARTSGSVVTSIQSFEVSGLSMVMQSPVFERQQVENDSLAYFVSVRKSRFSHFSFLLSIAFVTAITAGNSTAAITQTIQPSFQLSVGSVIAR